MVCVWGGGGGCQCHTPPKFLKTGKFCHKWQHLWLLAHPIQFGQFYKNSIFGRFNEHTPPIKVVLRHPCMQVAIFIKEVCIKYINSSCIMFTERPASPKPKTSSNVPRSSSQTNIGQKKNDDQLFEFLNSSPAGGDKKKIANQLGSPSPVQTSSPKMPKLNNAVQSEQNKKFNLTGPGNLSIGLEQRSNKMWVWVCLGLSIIGNLFKK